MDLGLGLGIELAGRLWVKITWQTNTGCTVMGACYRCPDQEEINKAFFNHPNIFFRDNTSRHKKSRLLEHTEGNFVRYFIKMITNERDVFDVIFTSKAELIRDVKVGTAFELPEMMESPRGEQAEQSKPCS